MRRRVATGGMGTLYLAHDPVLDRTVALKLFHGDLERPDARDKFVGEARAVAALNHPNIVTIYDYGEYGSQPFLVMEYIQGETLADLIRRRAAPPPLVALRWMEDLCAAVGYAHDRGIIHRDLKPANLMVDAYGRIKVLDFGIARMRGTLASQSTAVIGTPGYVAPEQIRGGTIDHRSDVFSIGVVCYELLSYVEPFGAGTTHAITHRTLADAPAPLDAVRPGVDPELAAIVLTALEKDPDARHQTADVMRDALGGVRRRLEAAEPDITVAMYVPPPSSAPEAAGSGDAAAGSAPVAADARPHRRTTRESLARQRQQQVEAWIALAREHVAAGEHAEARDACDQALRLEPGHPDALAALAALDYAAQGATMLRPRSPGDADVAARAGEGYTVVLPALRSSGHPRAEAPAADAGTPAPAAPAAAPVRPPASSPRQVPVSQASRPQPPRQRSTTSVAPWVAVGVLAAIVLVAGAGAWVVMRPGAAVQPVPVVIDATPWATVTSIEAADGTREPLPADRWTPLALALAPGSYRVSLAGPTPGEPPRAITIRVDAGAPSQVFLERFTPVTLEEYFRDYTAAGVPGTVGGSDAGGRP